MYVRVEERKRRCRRDILSTRHGSHSTGRRTSVVSPSRAPQSSRVKSKPHRVEEPAGTYTVSPKKRTPSVVSVPKADAGGVRYLDAPTARQLADKIFSERKNLLHRLAQ